MTRSISTRAFDRAIATLALVVAANITAACATAARLPGKSETDAVMSGKRAVVLLRLEGEVDGARPDPRKLELRLTRLDDLSRRPVVARPAPYSEAAARDGWAYLELEPGPYFVELPTLSACARCGVGASWGAARFGRIYRGEFVPTPAYVLDVPASQHVVYAGTVSLTVATQRSPGGPQPEYRAAVVDESPAARAHFDRAFAPLGLSAFVTSLMADYDRRLSPQTTRALSPIGLATATTDQLPRINWRGRVMGDWLTPSALLIGVGAQSGSSGGAFLIMLGVATVPIAAVGGLIAGEVVERQRRPCHEALVEELRDLQPQKGLGARIRTSLATHRPGEPTEPDQNMDDARSLLIVDIMRIELREAPGNRFAVEVAVRARLFDSATSRATYDRSLVYGLVGPRSARRPYEIPVPGSPTPRAIDDYCSAVGRARFRDDVSAAVEALGGQLVVDLGLASGPRAD